MLMAVGGRTAQCPMLRPLHSLDLIFAKVKLAECQPDPENDFLLRFQGLQVHCLCPKTSSGNQHQYAIHHAPGLTSQNGTAASVRFPCRQLQALVDGPSISPNEELLQA